MNQKSVIIRGVKDVGIESQEFERRNIGVDECLIETEVSLISPGTELSRVFGLKQGATYPVYPGYCSVGQVLEVGDNIDGITSGDRVLFSGPHKNIQYYDKNKSDGGILYRLEPETKAENGALLMMSWIAMNGILPVDVKSQDTVLINGLGTLGLILVILYKQMGVQVIACDPEEHRALLAKKFGADTVLFGSIDTFSRRIMEATDYEGVNIAVEASGYSSGIETCIEATSYLGTILLLGSPRTAYELDVTPMFNAIHTKMLHIIGAMNRRYPYEESVGSKLSIKRSMKYLERLLNEGVINSDDFISHRVNADAEELFKAYDGLMNDKNNYTGVIIDWRKK